jgi:transposase-like protein
MSFPKDHRPKIHSTNPLERLNGEIKRRTEVVVGTQSTPAAVNFIQP